MKKLYQDTTYYLIIFIISYFIYIYPFEILSEFLFNQKTNRIYSFIYSILISALIILYFKTKITFLPLKIFIYEGMGIGFISFIIINFLLIINFIISINEFYLGIISLILIILISLIGFYYGNKIFIKKIKISSKKTKRIYKFILITDIHLGTNSVLHLQKILNKIKKIEYDFILIGGDLIDSSSFEISQLSILKEIYKPIYFVTGNHEYYIKNYKDKLSKLKNFGITTLDNENVNLDDINLIGISDLQSPKEQNSNFLKLRKDMNYNILLIHKPSIWSEINNNVDLMLSGHCHAGQIIPFNFFVKLQFNFIYGLLKHYNSNLYVSSGSGCWGPRLRVGTINEIVSFEIHPNIME